MAFRIFWLGQGGFLLEMGDVSLAVDPYLSNPQFSNSSRWNRLIAPPIEPEALRADVMVFTHDHVDHLDPDTVSRTQTAQYAGPPSCIAHLKKLDIAADRLALLGRGDVMRLGRARVMGVLARHTEDSIGLFIEYANLSIYLTGDTCFDAALVDVGALGVDILIACINGQLGNMNADEAAALARALPCRLAIPMHYGMFAENTADPADFERAMAGSGIPVALLEPGIAVDVLELMKRTV